MSDEHQKSDRRGQIFSAINWFNAIGVFMLLLFALAFIIVSTLQSIGSGSGHYDAGAGFGSGRETLSKIIGQSIGTRDGEVVAYYEEDGVGERDDLGGVTLVDTKTGKMLEIGKGQNKSVIIFDLLYDQSRSGGKVFGYLATIATSEQYIEGRADLVIGSFPEMTRNVIAEDILFVDSPSIRGDSTVAAIIWSDDTSARLVVIDPRKGEILDSSKVALPPLKDETLSQGPGIPSDPYLARKPDLGPGPINKFGY